MDQKTQQTIIPGKSPGYRCILEKEMELVRTEVIPYQWNALNDNVPGAAPSFCMPELPPRR